MLCGDLDGWVGGVEGRSRREGIYVYIQLIHFIVQQKLTQHCKATIFQLKIYIRRAQIKLLEMKNAISEVKNTLDAINSSLDTALLKKISVTLKS